MGKKEDDVICNELIRGLEGKGAHADFDTAVANIPKELYGKSVRGVPYTLWQLLEHIRMSQWDILDYMRNPDYQEKIWPDDYWPKEKGPASDKEWDVSVKQYRKDLADLKKLVKASKGKILDPLPHIKKGPSVFHEVLLVIDHNSYHIGQLILIRRLLGAWR